MNLGFSRKIFGEPTFFKQKILSGEKIHTIRETDRIQPGHVLHMCYDNRQKTRESFFEKGKEPICISTQKIEIIYRDCHVFHLISFVIDNRSILSDSYEIDFLSSNDGLSKEVFFQYFYSRSVLTDLEGVRVFKGNIIHWTNFKY